VKDSGYNSKRILILDAGEAPYSLVAARSLGSAGHQVVLGFPYGSHTFDAYSKYCRGYFFYPDPSYAPEDFQRHLRSLAARFDFIIPTMEKTQLATSMIKGDLEDAGAIVPIPEYETYCKAVDKDKILEIARESGVTVPKTEMLTEEPEFQKVVKEFGFPFIMKVSTEMNIPPSERHYIIREESEEDFSHKFNKLLRLARPVILQQYVEGVGVGASFIFSENHRPIAAFGHKRILEQFPEGGPSAIAETYFNPDALKQGLRLLKALKWKGVAMTEYKMNSDGTMYFMEMNPRFWGTLPLAIASGVDFPRLLVEHYRSEDGRPRVVYRKRMFVSVQGIGIRMLDSLHSTKGPMIPPGLFRGIIGGGFPVIEELLKRDIRPLLVRMMHHARAYRNRNRVSRIGDVFLGPAIKYERLAEYGIKAVINLAEELPPSTNPGDNSTKFLYYPIKDDSAPETESLISLIMRTTEFAKEGRVYVHCRLGRGRSPMVVIGYLISKGMGINQAYATVYDARPFAHLNLIQKGAVYKLYRHYLDEASAGSVDSA